ncbi:MAG: alpha/beta fold hydrolase [Candidatus Woesearchaeota archaeon]
MNGIGTLRTFEGKNGIPLHGVAFMPEVGTYFVEVDGELVEKAYKPLGSLYFVHGISARWEDYASLLVPLSRSFNVYAYNQRGHGSSPGKFDVMAAADDLECIIEKEREGPIGILAHSLGCMAAVVAKRFEKKGKPLDGVFMMAPYLGMEFLRWPQRYAIRVLSHLRPALKIVDRLLNSMESWREKHGFHQRYVLDSFAELASVNAEDSRGMTMPVGYILTENDRVLGTHRQKHYFACMDLLRNLLPHGVNYTNTEIAFLNHCLNMDVVKPYLIPFLKVEPRTAEREAQRAYVLGSIYLFFKAVFEKNLKPADGNPQ